MADAPEDRSERRSARDGSNAEPESGAQPEHRHRPERRFRPERRLDDTGETPAGAFTSPHQPRAVHARAREERAAILRALRTSGNASPPATADDADPITGSAAPAHEGRIERPERRERPRRRSDRARERPTTRGSRTRREEPERRADRSLHDKRQYWSGVRREIERYKLEPFLQLLTRLAQVVFGPSATVMPHLRGRQRQRHVAFIVDAAHPEALASYEEFLPLEKQFWTAYGTLPKPAAPFLVAIRPARGWVRNEALAPIYTEFGNAELLS